MAEGQEEKADGKAEGQEGKAEGQEGKAEGQEGKAGGQEEAKAEGLEARADASEDTAAEPDGNAGGADVSTEAPEGELPVRAAAELKAILEALIFASPEPLTAKAMFKLLDTEPKEDVEAALAALKQEYDRPGGLQLVEVAGGYPIVTRPDLHEWVRRALHAAT